MLKFDERELIGFNVQNINSAVLKSKADQTYTLYKGLSDSSWLKDLNVGDIFTDKGLGSYSLDYDKAYQYTDPENPVILQLEIEKGMNVLYVDETEREMLRPRDITYEIKKINRNYLFKGKNMTIVYNTKELQE